MAGPLREEPFFAASLCYSTKKNLTAKFSFIIILLIDNKPFPFKKTVVCTVSSVDLCTEYCDLRLDFFLQKLYFNVFVKDISIQL